MRMGEWKFSGCKVEVTFGTFGKLLQMEDGAKEVLLERRLLALWEVSRQGTITMAAWNCSEWA